MTVELQVPDKGRRPQHVAIVLDGTARWAMEHGLSRLEAHQRGVDAMRDVTLFTRELQIPNLTLLAFSARGWERPAEEVAGVMDTLADYCENERATLSAQHIRVTHMGRTSRLPTRTRVALEGLVAHTGQSAHPPQMTLRLALDYDARLEMVEAVRQVVEDVRAARLPVDAIDEGAVGARLQTAQGPDPDLLIRTAGVMRLSNFMLWQLAYTELHFSDACWPAFSRADYAAALRDFAARERRFGATGEQVAAHGSRAAGSASEAGGDSGSDSGDDGTPSC